MKHLGEMVATNQSTLLCRRSGGKATWEQFLFLCVNKVMGFFISLRPFGFRIIQP